MKTNKRVVLYVSLFLIALALIGCTPKKDIDNNVIVDDQNKVEDVENLESNYPLEIEDNFGNKETIEDEPMKIVSLAPHNTEILFALGLGDKVIGVTSYCTYPEEAASKEIIGGFSEFNLEKIVELNPDLVLAYGSGDEEENKILRDAGIKVLGFMPENFDGVTEDIISIGKITGADQEASELVDSMVERKDLIVEKVKGQENVSVFYEIWHDPLQAAGSGSFMGELIKLAGGENIAEDAEEPYPLYDLEQLIERNPDVYLTSADMPEKTIESIKDRPGYEGISAIKNDRIYIFAGNEADVVSRPGPRIIDALELVAKSIHPELFE